MSWNIAKPGDQINGPVAVTGNLNVDSNTLFVDSANNRVGVLTASPTVPLDVVGDAKVSGNLTVDTNTLVVDAANNRLGIGTATPGYPLSVNGRISYIGAIGEGADTTLSSSSTGLLHGNSSYWTEHRFYASGNEQHRIAQSGVFTWYDGAGGTRMTLNGTGLGVGVSPNTILHVRKDFAGYTTIKAENQHTIAAGTGISFTINDGGTDASWFRRHRDGTGNTDIGYNAALRFRGQVTATERTDMLIDTNGNLGLGVTPANWSSLIGPVLQINNGSFYAYSNEIRINANFKYDGADKYISNGYATSYNQASGAHYWYSAANNTSGANAALTWGGAKMSLDASGNLLVGAASASGRLHVESQTTVNTVLKNGASGVDIRSYAGSSVGTVGTYSNHNFSLFANDTIRLTVKTTGQVNFVGLASDPAGAAAGDVYYNTTTNKLKCYNGTTWNDLF